MCSRSRTTSSTRVASSDFSYGAEASRARKRSRRSNAHCRSGAGRRTSGHRRHRSCRVGRPYDRLEPIETTKGGTDARQDALFTTSTWVPVARIRISPRRTRGLSPATVELYRRWLEEGREAPPVRLIRDGDGFLVRDGRHRIAAARAAGHGFVEAHVREVGHRRSTDSSDEPPALESDHTKRAWGRSFCRRNASLAPRKSGFDSRRLHSWGRSMRSAIAPARVPGSCLAKPDKAAGRRGFESLRLH